MTLLSVHIETILAFNIADSPIEQAAMRRAECVKHLEDFLNNAQPGLSFWCDRVVTLEGYEGSVSFSELHDKVTTLVWITFTPPDFTLEQFRGVRESLAGLLDRSAQFSKEARESSLITRIIMWIREFFGEHIYPTRDSCGLFEPVLESRFTECGD